MKKSFSKRYRLSSRKRIQEIFQIGKFGRSGVLRFRYAPQGEGYCRFVISISKRVGNSPQRNRLKRLIREALRLSGKLDSFSMDCCIFITHPLRRETDFAEIEGFVKRIFSSFPNENLNTN